MDKYTLDKSLDDDQPDHIFQGRKWLFVNDSNNGNYDNGVVQIETTSLANSGHFMDYSQAVLTLPLIVTLSSVNHPINWSSINAEFMCGLKSGFTNLIHKFSVEYNNSTIISPVDFTNAYVSYKLMNTLCVNDLETICPSMGFYPDEHKSASYMPYHSAFGHGAVNNSNISLPIKPSDGWRASQLALGNTGFMKRQESTSVCIPGTTSELTDEGIQRSRQNNIVIKEAKYCAMYIYAQIRLKDLHSYFQQVPLLKGSVYRFNFTTNQSSFQVVKSGTDGLYGPSTGVACTNATCAISFDPTTMLLPSNGTNVLMISATNGSAGTGGSGMSVYDTRAIAASTGTASDLATGLRAYEAYAESPQANRTINCSVSICKVTDARQASLNVLPWQITAQLWVPAYHMSSTWNLEYLAKVNKTITYTGFEYSSLNNISPGNTFSKQVSSGIRGLKKIIVMPFISASKNGMVPAVGGQLAKPAFSVFRSPFTHEPAGTSAVGSAFSALNVRIGGQNLLTTDMLYTFDAFEQNLSGIDALSGNQLPGLSSSLLNRDKWRGIYQYYVFDCSRRPIESFDIAQTVDVFGCVSSKYELDCLIFMEYDRTITFDIGTGAITQM